MTSADIGHMPTDPRLRSRWFSSLADGFEVICTGAVASVITSVWTSGREVIQDIRVGKTVDVRRSRTWEAGAIATVCYCHGLGSMQVLQSTVAAVTPRMTLRGRL